MIGGPPVFMPSYAPAQPFRPAPPRQAAFVPPTATYRGARPEEPPAPRRLAPPAPVTIPSPEQLGVALGRSTESAIDWPTTTAHLKQLGAVSHFLERLPEAGYRFSCWLPRPDGRTERIEARAATEAQAIRDCLVQASRWKEQAR